MRSLFLASLALCFSAFAQPADHTKPEFEYWINPERSDSMPGSDADFQPLANQTLDLGLVRGSVWLRARYPLSETQQTDHYLTLNKIHLREVDFYQFIDGKLIREVATGTNKPFSTRDLEIPHWALLLSPIKGEHEILLRLSSRSPIQTRVEITTSREIIHSSSRQLIYFSVLIGLFGFLFIIGFVLAWVFPHRVIWLGHLLITGALLNITSSSGLGFAFLWQNLPELNPVLSRLSLGIAVGGTGLFCVEYLKVRSFAPTLATITNLLSLLLMFSMILPMPSISPLFTVIIVASAPISALVCAIAAQRQKAPGASLFLTSFATFAIAVFGSVLAAYSVLPDAIDYGLLLNFGMIIMVLMLAFGTVQRFGEYAFSNAISSESAKAKSLFFATMSHEIRTPINGVLGMLTLLQKDNLNESQQRLAAHAKSSATSLLDLVNDVLDFSKIEAGKMDLEFIEFDIVILLEEVVESFACIESNHHLEILLDTSDIQNGKIVSDPARIRQILNNLLSNALKFTEQGEVIVKAKLQKQTRFAQLSISIKDSGIGIEAHKLPGLFTMFTQADGSTTRKYGGTGLGLSIVKNLCELMEGNLVATSKPGVGSKFSFDLQVEVITNEEPLFTSLQSKTVLVYDANPNTQKAITKYLSSWGAKVTSATNKQQFSNRLTSLQPDIAISSERVTQIDASTLFIQSTKPTSEIFQTPVILKPISASKLKQAIFDQPADKQDTANVSAETQQKPFRLLLVEDNLINTEVALGILEEYGYDDVEHAEHGQQAIELLQQGEFDLVLMDCQMPTLDGYETTKKIRAGLAGCISDIPIIAMTANAMTGDKEKCLSFGMDDYISKPIDPDKLASSLSQWLQT